MKKKMDKSIGKTTSGISAGVVGIIMVTLVVVILTALFIALWTPTIRPNLVSLANDANTAARYGVGLTNSFLYIIDLVPILWFFGAFVLVAGTAYMKIHTMSKGL
jgi:hypothetical protein